MDDTVSYYYGRNRFVYDMIGVTAACLIMRRSYYLAIGGLYEGLAVAYNDVDLCFRLCGKGLYNVQRNDVVLYHHESLSRGDDLQDEAKIRRLQAERDVLYKRHPKLYRQDPFIGTLLNSGEPEDCRHPTTKSVEMQPYFPVFSHTNPAGQEKFFSRRIFPAHFCLCAQCVEAFLLSVCRKMSKNVE